MADVRAQLVQAYNWIKEGKKAEAEALLIRILGNDEKNADAWWLLANALTDPAEQAEALDQLLELRPGDEKATKMLARLRLTPPSTPIPSARPPAQSAAAPPPARPAAPPPSPPARRADPFETVEDDGDPFADVKSSDDDPFAEVVDSRSRRPADPFDDEDDPFAVAEAAQKKKPGAKNASASFERPERAPSRWDGKQKSGDSGNRLLVILGIVVVGLVACGLICAFTINQMQQGALNIFNQVMADPTVQAALQDPTLQAAIAADPTLQAVMQAGGVTGGFAPARVPTDTTPRGPLMPNQNASAVVDTFTDDSWIFNADAGARYIVEVTATDGQLDPQVAVYGADNQLIAQNDDIDFMENRNSRAEFTASQNGIYTIIVSAFGEGGSYNVVVRR